MASKSTLMCSLAVVQFCLGNLARNVFVFMLSVHGNVIVTLCGEIKSMSHM